MKIFKPSEIRAMRVKLGLTQVQLAELAGVTQAYIAKIEAGAADPKVSTLENILKALNRATTEKRACAEEIMASPIVAVKPGDRIEKAVRLMNAYKISQLPVLDGETLVGSISEATLMHKITAGEDMSRLVRRSIDEIMESPFPTVSKDTDVDTIYFLLGHNQAVLVVDRGRAVGIVTKADILKRTGELRKLKS